jgi:hypothetical protein
MCALMRCGKLLFYNQCTWSGMIKSRAVSYRLLAIVDHTGLLDQALFHLGIKNPRAGSSIGGYFFVLFAYHLPRFQEDDRREYGGVTVFHGLFNMAICMSGKKIRVVRSLLRPAGRYSLHGRGAESPRSSVRETPCSIECRSAALTGRTSHFLAACPLSIFWTGYPFRRCFRNGIDAC